MKNLLKYWNDLKRTLRDSSIMLFLDYDGTLAPIAEKPDGARCSQEVKKILEALSENPNRKVAVISGRRLEDVKKRIGLKGVIYSGNHGLEIEGPKIRFRPFIPVKYAGILSRIKRDLEKGLSSIKGVIVEDKRLSLSLHYRLASKRRVPFIKKVFHDRTLVDWVRGKIEIKTGKKVLEVRPPLEWNKGKVVLWLLARQKLTAGNKRIVPIYIGDDVTDEDAFDALKNKGITIFVGRPRRSAAAYYLRNPKEVGDFLRRVSLIDAGEV